MNLSELKKIIPFQWRVQSYSKTSPYASYVAYIDARDVMDLLDDVCSPENWQSDYKQVKNNLYAGIAIKIDGEWVWKWDCGTESKTEGEKGEASDSFKRAAVKWGIGRFLYDIEIQFLKQNTIKSQGNYPYPVDNNGEKIDDINKYLSNKTKPQKQQIETKKENSSTGTQQLKQQVEIKNETKQDSSPTGNFFDKKIEGKILTYIKNQKFSNIKEWADHMVNTNKYYLEKGYVPLLDLVWFTDAYETVKPVTE